MREIVTWLLRIEKLAGKVYRKTAKKIENEPVLSKFMEEMADDEAWHFHVMGSALQYLRSNSLEAGSAITLDNETKTTVETSLLTVKESIDNNSLNADTIFTNLIESEFSEWNDIFLYVVHSLSEHSIEFKTAVSLIDNHIERLETFLAGYPGGNMYLERLMERSINRNKKILLMIDLPSVKKLLQAILKHDYLLDECSDGEEGLKKIKENYYDCIISDIDMPEMNGIDFYNLASRDDKSIKSKMLFISSIPFHHSFYDKHDLKWLAKPFSLTSVREKDYFYPQ
jgi:CheY-like chemotaxis protein